MGNGRHAATRPAKDDRRADRVCPAGVQRPDRVGSIGGTCDLGAGVGQRKGERPRAGGDGVAGTGRVRECQTQHRDGGAQLRLSCARRAGEGGIGAGWGRAAPV